MLMVPSMHGFIGAGVPLSTLDPAFKSPNVALSNSNLTATATVQSAGAVIGTQGARSGKLYFEATFNILTGQSGGLGSFVGLVNTYFARFQGDSGFDLTRIGYPGGDAYSWGIGQYPDTSIRFLAAGIAYGGTVGVGSNGFVAMMAVDLGAGYIWVGMNGTWYGYIPPNGPLVVYRVGNGPTLWPCVYVLGNPNFSQVTFNPGPAFQYGPPAGFTAWGAGDGTGQFVSTAVTGGGT
jgi:hypothetical protein